VIKVSDRRRLGFFNVLHVLCGIEQAEQFIDNFVINKKNMSPIERIMTFRIVSSYIHLVPDDGKLITVPSKVMKMSSYEAADVERDIRHFWTEKGLREAIGGAHCFVQVSRRKLSRKAMREVDEYITKIYKKDKEKETQEKDRINTGMMYV